MTYLKRTSLAAILAAVLVIATGPGAGALAGDVDTGFGTAGSTTVAQPGVYSDISIMKQSTGELVVVWSSGSTIGASGFTANGIPDPGFGTAGSSTIAIPGTNSVRSIDAVVDSHDKIVVGGYTNETVGDDMVLAARFKADGTPDNSFSSDAFNTVAFTQGSSYGYGVNVMTTGKIILVGEVDPTVDPASNVALVRLNSNGTTDLGFGTNGTKMVMLDDSVDGYDGLWRVLPLSNGRFVAAGWQDVGGGVYDTLVMQFKGGGGPDRTFASGKGWESITVDPADDDWAYGLAKDGSLIVLGVSGQSLKPSFIRLKADGSRDNSFGNHGIARFVTATYFYLFGVAVDSKHRIVAVSSGQYLPTMRIKNDGSIDGSYGTAGFASNPGNNMVGRDLVLQGKKPVPVGASSGYFAMTRYLG